MSFYVTKCKYTREKKHGKKDILAYFYLGKIAAFIFFISQMYMCIFAKNF